MLHSHLRAGVGLIVAALVCAAVTAHGDQQGTRKDADTFKTKIGAVSKRGAVADPKPLKTLVSEREVNAYLAYGAEEHIPSGVVNPSMAILGDGRVSGTAVVDLDRVRRARNATSWFDPVSYLTGTLPVAASGRLTTRNGVGHFELQSASVASIPVPKVFLQQIVSYYTQSPSRPSGIRIDDPFALPARIREIEVGRGEATIVQ
jgi:hypothetical protein